MLVVIVGSFYIKAANYTPFIPPAETGGTSGSGVDQSLFSLMTGAASSHYGIYGVLAGASIVFFAFIGFDVVATTAEETKDPQRDVAKGILASLAIVTVLYVAVSIVLSGMVPYTALKSCRRRIEGQPGHRVRGQRRRLGRQDHFHRRTGGPDHGGHGAHARPVQGAVRDGARRTAAARAGQDRAAWHTGAHHDAGCGADRHCGVGVPDGQARRDGERRDAVRVRPGLRRCDRAAPHPSGSQARIPGAMGARRCRSRRSRRACG